MGLDLGLEQEGFVSVVANDNDSAAVETIRLNRPELPVLDRPVEQLSAEDFEEAAGMPLRGIPLVAGGPPCQAFAIFGRRRGLSDTRGQLIFEFIRMVDELRPMTFAMENVRGLHSMTLAVKGHGSQSGPRVPGAHAHGSLLRRIFQEFHSIGYRVDCFVVNAVNYGAPQLRERVVLIGNKYDVENGFPEPRFSNRPEDSLPPFTTLGEVIGDGFEDPDADCMDFSERKLRYLALVPPGGNWRSLPVEIQREAMGKQYYLKGGRSSTWRKLSFDFPCPTIQTMPNHAATSMCHPTELRALTVGECATVQEFPAGWRFVGNATEKMRQIGNAVPVRLGRVTAEAISDLLARIEEGGMTERVPTSVSRIVHLRPHVRTRTFWRNGEAFAGSHSYVTPRADQMALEY
jgi:DNA (cytosine-5)-methyltransferase 1